MAVISLSLNVLRSGQCHHGHIILYKPLLEDNMNKFVYRYIFLTSLLALKFTFLLDYQFIYSLIIIYSCIESYFFLVGYRFRRWVMHICEVNCVIIGSDNVLSSARRQAIGWTNANLSLIETFGTRLQWNANQNTKAFVKRKHSKMSSAKRWQFYPGLIVLNSPRPCRTRNVISGTQDKSHVTMSTQPCLTNCSSMSWCKVCM